MTGRLEESVANVLGTEGTAWSPETRLYSDGVVTGADGTPQVVPPHSGLRRIAGTGFLDRAAGELAGALVPTREQADDAVNRLGKAALPGLHGPYGDMARTALVDIAVLTCPNGAAVAAGSPYWRYVWPRDAGFMSVALSLVGLHDDALRLIRYVAGLQEDDGGWQARYLPDGSGDVPDGRGRQLDGIGWTLWAAWMWTRTGGGQAGPLLGMAGRAVHTALAVLDPASHLPEASQDFWEMDIEETTLGTAAPLLLGLRCGADLLAGSDDTGHVALAEHAEDAAADLEAAIHTAFGAHGYGRRVSGQGGRDASVVFLLPPFAPSIGADVGGVEEAWRAAVAATTVPNGGVRPGEEWTDQVTAWTPQVSLHALTAAAVGDTALAHRLLSWLDLRRTAFGSLPEKVTDDGRPAAVAPLGLTGATVLMALAELDGRRLPVPGAGSHQSAAPERTNDGS